MTPQKKKHLVISLALTAATLFFAYLYFNPAPNKKKTISPQVEIKNKSDYDSILTNLLKDSNSNFRKAFDSIYAKSKTNPIKKPRPDQIKPKPKTKLK